MIPKPFSTVGDRHRRTDGRCRHRPRTSSSRRAATWSSARAARDQVPRDAGQLQLPVVMLSRQLLLELALNWNYDHHAADLFAPIRRARHAAGASRSGSNGPTCSTAWPQRWVQARRPDGCAAAGDARRARPRARRRLPRRRSRRIAGRAVKLDEDTYTSPESVEIADLAAGGVVQAAEHALNSARAGVRARASAGPPRRTGPRDGLLPLQQRRGRRGGRPCPRRRARRHRRHRRPSRQRVAVDVLRRSVGAVRVEPPVSLLSGNRRRRRDRHG